MLTWGRKPGWPLTSGCLDELAADRASMVAFVVGDDEVDSQVDSRIDSSHRNVLPDTTCR